MHNSKVLVPACNILLFSLRKLHRSIPLQARLVKNRNKSFSNLNTGPEVTSSKFYKNDLEDIENLDADDIDEEFDLSKADIAYDIHRRESKAWKERIERKIVKQKFFAPGKEPYMLTHNEKSCIKYLHEQDPVQWNIRTLSESFPATPVTIQKILKSKWKETPERIKKMNSNVLKNWKLLEEDKLDAPPDVLEHYKKFVNKREVLLEQLKNSKFNMPEVKQEKRWNNAQMASILNSYEKEINMLCSQKQKCLRGCENKDEKNQENELKARDILSEQINKKVAKLDLEGKDTFVLNKVFNSNMITHEELFSETIRKHERKEKLNLSEKAVLEYQKCNNTLGSSKISSDSSTDFISSPENDHENEIYDSFSSQKNENSAKLNTPLNVTEKELKKFQRKYFLTSELQESISQVGNNTKLLSELEVGKHMKQDENDVKTGVKKSLTRFEQLMRENPKRAIKDENYYMSEVEDIKHTAFWDNNEGSNGKALRETQKKPLYAPPNTVNNNNGTESDLTSTYSYPERIKIPKHHIGSGLTFKVNDCYYDDDGQFLYRVPGMKN